MFCRFCNHSVGFMRVDTVKDHLESKKARVKQRTKNLFILDYIKICYMSDIQLPRMGKMKPFLPHTCSASGIK